MARILSFRNLLLTGSTLAAVLLTASLATAQDQAAPKTGAMATKPTDPQIAQIMSTANMNEITAAKLAQTKSTNEQVKKFADLMIKDHTKLNDQMTALTTKLKMTPEDSPMSTELKDQGTKTATTLQGLDGAAFDKAYVDSQVTDHKNLLSMMDNTLNASAKNPELKAMLKKARPIVAEHLQHAKKLEAVVNGEAKAMGKHH